jgi:hypothetical protein
VVCFVDEYDSSVLATGGECLKDSWRVIGAVEAWLDDAGLLFFGCRMRAM